MKAVLLLYQENMMPDLTEAMDNAKYSVVVTEAKDLLAETDIVVSMIAQSMNYSPTSHRIWPKPTN